MRIPRQSTSFPQQIEEAAMNTRSLWGLGLDAPVANVTRAAERAGAVVAHFASASDKVDATSCPGTRPVIVRSSAKQSATRLRWDIAHELGHLVLRHDASADDVDEHEAQADKFAGAFLVPAAPFIREFPKGGRLPWQELFRA